MNQRNYQALLLTANIGHSSPKTDGQHFFSFIQIALVHFWFGPCGLCWDENGEFSNRSEELLLKEEIVKSNNCLSWLLEAIFINHRTALNQKPFPLKCNKRIWIGRRSKKLESHMWWGWRVVRET